MSAAAEIPWKPQDSKTELHPLSEHVSEHIFEHVFEHVFENAPIGLAQCQRAGNITALNPALEQMLGGKSGARSRMARGLSFADLVHPDDRAEADRLLGELFSGRRDHFQMDSKNPLSNTFASTSGNPLRTIPTVRWTAWRVPSTNSDPDHALVLAECGSRDLLREQEIEQRFRQAQKLEAVGRLAGGAAHDFNNLLTGVLLYCDLLMAHLAPDQLEPNQPGADRLGRNQRARQYAEEIRNASLQATGLVRQLLAVSRPATGEPRLLVLNQIAEGMHNLLARLIGENIELQFHLDPNLGVIRMDPTQCQQILLNLVLNARDAILQATPIGGQITVETSNCKVQVLPDQVPTEQVPPEPRSGAASQTSLPCALFVVKDNGSGMDAATRAHLFEAFFTTKAENGTGLGLATVHEIVTSNGGLILVDSAPGAGTRVSVLLPLVPQTVLHPRDARDFQPDRNSEERVPEI
jgi:two-component system cell cycle sensor histidine kinase/response regulator CckA